MTETLWINIGLTAESPEVVRGATFPTGGTPRQGAAQTLKNLPSGQFPSDFNRFLANDAESVRQELGVLKGASFWGGGLPRRLPP